ncbi:Ribosomal lysine N-methyltransferase set10 [Psilocybe cubensis]|uniref:SET domain-containing protein n=2 Tax=Psilocybe cubensis TaxID=181762 RepID=A0A8H7XY65_PSICU|nr:Ribosomal lysine N-methyltransferase set10 [Psilocybe cubensis]KAH9482517.1 Ribosomal lysine N-methyltransferase set10 [Psilocybe cubensis]
MNIDDSGSHVIATADLGQDSVIVECPFQLIITKESAKKAVLNILHGDVPNIAYETWTERQWICTYIALHWILGSSEKRLLHFEYLNTLPTPGQLKTPLHFSPSELDLFKGTNLYSATLDRQREWNEEWSSCRSIVSQANAETGACFEWELYLRAATYLSSRAFPSSLLAETPSLVSTPFTGPILIPGVDALNHKRGEPVSWLVNHTSDSTTQSKISLVLHSSAVSGQELFNNYGPKPNSELILGYGFSTPRNPDDTMVLKIGGIGGQKWEIGRSGERVDGLWTEILNTIVEAEDNKPTYEDILDASGMLQEMVQTLIERLPEDRIPEDSEVRPEVATMFLDYLEGQRDILRSLMTFATQREHDAVEIARQQGIDLVLED